MSELFDERVAREYAHHRGYVDESFVDELAAVLAPGRVLDVGAGVGAPARALRRRGVEVVALEPSRAMIEQGLQEADAPRFVQGLGEALPFRSGVFGSALILYVLHHADDPAAVLSESCRVLQASGRVVVVTGGPASARQDFFRRYFPTLSPELPDVDDIVRWAAPAKLEVREVRTAVHWMFRSRTIDDEYLSVVSNQMFATLRLLNPGEFARGIKQLRADFGKPIPPPEVTVAVLDRSRES